MSPPKSRFSCWSCGVTATHRTLTTTPEHMRTPDAGEWVCFHCISTYQKEKTS